MRAVEVFDQDLRCSTQEIPKSCVLSFLIYKSFILY